MTAYIEIANLGRLAQDTVHDLKARGGHVPITRFGQPTGAHLVVAKPDAPMSLPEAITEAVGLLDAFDDTRPDEMTPFFTHHAFNELTLLLRDLLDALGEP